MSVPWYVEYWHIFPSIVAMLGTILLPLAYVRWLRRLGVSEPRELVTRLATFYKLLTIVCFIPVISPSYWAALNILNIVQPFLEVPLMGGAGTGGVMFVFWLSLSFMLSFLCVATATGLPQGRRRVLGLAVSMLFVVSGLFAVGSLYRDLLCALGDPWYYWICILLYILANLSQATMNLVTIYYNARLQRVGNVSKQSW